MIENRLDAIDWNHQLANYAFLGTSVTGALFENRDLWISHCGFPATEFNHAFLKRPGVRLEKSIEVAERYFADLTLPFAFMCRSDLADACAEGLAAAGYERSGEIPVMVLDPIPPELPKPPASVGHLDISPVESEEELETYQGVAIEGFGLPREAGPLFLTKAFYRLPNVRLYLGRLEGEPVCTSALIATGPVAGIFWVATLESHRGRGLGAAVTMSAVLGGAEYACRFASLQASKLGRPVYERLGFETPAHYVEFARLVD